GAEHDGGGQAEGEGGDDAGDGRGLTHGGSWAGGVRGQSLPQDAPRGQCAGALTNARPRYFAVSGFDATWTRTLRHRNQRSAIFPLSLWKTPDAALARHSPSR